MRVPSKNECKGGGFYHFYDNGVKQYVAPQARRFEPVKLQFTPDHMMKQWGSLDTSAMMIDSFAVSLGVDGGACRDMGVVWSRDMNAWAFPMWMVENSPDSTWSHTIMCGIRLRSDSGFKWSVKGSRGGVFLGQQNRLDSTVYLPEGPTSSLALMSMGLHVIGRPSSNSGNDVVVNALKHFRARRAVIVADNDEEKQNGTIKWRPGRVGAERLQKDLQKAGLRSVIWDVPTPNKDARDFLRRGGFAKLIETQINQMTWI
jgi:hypothetical protein